MHMDIPPSPPLLGTQCGSGSISVLDCIDYYQLTPLLVDFHDCGAS